MITVIALFKVFPNYTIHNTNGDNLGQTPGELVSLHMTQESANAALETAIQKAKQDTDTFMCDMPQFYTEPITVK